MKSNSNKHSSNRLQNQILTMTLIFTFFIGGIVAASFSYLYKHYLQNSLLQTTDINLQFLIDSVENSMEGVQQLIGMAQTNSTIGEFVDCTAENGILSIKAHSRLNEDYQNNTSKEYMHRVIIVNDTIDKFIQIVPSTHSSIINIALEAPKLGFFDTLLHSSGYNYSAGFINDPFYKGLPKQILPIIRPITNRYSSDYSGFIMIALTEQLFTNPLKYYSMSEDSELYLTLNEHIYKMAPGGLTEVFSSSEITQDLQTAALSPSTSAHWIKNMETGKPSLIITKPLNMAGCFISQTISPSELYSQRTLLLTMVFILMFLIIILGMLLSYLLSRTINLPVRQLRDKLSSIALGNFSRDASIEWNHELGDVGRGINALSESVVRLMEHRIDDEKQKKDLEYQMLQSQINPHFLYNTLNSIKWMASVQGAEGISEMTTALSRLLRSISKGTKLLIPLKDELSLLKDYFTIQQYRYGGIISMDIAVNDDRLYDCLLIKFTLQPLVENAIFHGIEPKGEAGHIQISADYTSDGNVEIIVYDNGVGMSSEIAEQLLTEGNDNKSDFFKEIGVSNVHKRLQYEFGSQYGITIDSKKGEYTRMKITLPARLDESIHQIVR